MGGPGSGRHKGHSRVAGDPDPPANGHANGRVTFGQMFATLPATAPAPAIPDAQPGTPPPVAGPAPRAAAAAPPREENRSFAKLVGYVSANVAVAVIGDDLRRKGFEPREPSSEDVERTSEATADAIVVALGDMSVPWWGVLLASYGNLWLSMRVGAQRLEPPDQAPATTPPSSPLGQSISAPARRQPPPRPGGTLPAIEASST